MEVEKEKKISIKGKQNPMKYIDLEPKLDDKFNMGEERIKLSKKAKEILDKAIEESLSLDDSLDEEYLEEKIRPITYAERLKRAQTMRRYAGKIEMAKERAAMRRASPEKIRSRARKKALEIIRSRISKNKAYSDLSTSEKIAIDRRLQGIPQVVIDRIARKQLPVIKRAEADRIQNRMHHTSTSASSTGHVSPKHESVDLNDLFESFLEEKVKHLVHTPKRPHSLYSKSGTVKFDKRFKLFRKKIHENNLEELESLAESLEEFEEGFQTNRVRSAIESERAADRVRHQRMIQTARSSDARRKQLLQREDASPIDQIVSRETKHKRLIAALKQYGDAVKGMKYEPSEKKRGIAKGIIDSNGITDFTDEKLMGLHGRIANSKRYEKAFNVFDVFEDKNTPSDREWGKPSLTKIYKQETPGETVTEEGKGLWYNIRQRRKKGLPRLKPGQKGYPETLDIEKD